MTLELRPSSTQLQLANLFPLDAETQEICKLQNEQNEIQRFLKSIPKKIEELVKATEIPPDERAKRLFEYSVQEKQAQIREPELIQLFWQKVIPYYKEHTKKERKTLVHALNPLSAKNRSMMIKAIRSRLKPNSITEDQTPVLLQTILENPEQHVNQYIEEIQQCFAKNNTAYRHWKHIDGKTKHIKSQLAMTSRFGPPSRLKNLSKERESAHLQLQFTSAKFWRKVTAYWNNNLGDPDELIDALYPNDSPERSTFIDQLSEELATDSSPNETTTLMCKEESVLALLALHSSQ
jgi:hypothetical protein